MLYNLWIFWVHLDNSSTDRSLVILDHIIIITKSIPKPQYPYSWQDWLKKIKYDPKHHSNFAGMALGQPFTSVSPNETNARPTTRHTGNYITTHGQELVGSGTSRQCDWGLVNEWILNSYINITWACRYTIRNRSW